MLIFVQSEQRGAEHPGAYTMTRQSNSGVAGQAGVHVLHRDSRGGLEQQLAGHHRAAPDHHLVGVERVDRVRDPDSEPLRPGLDRPRRVRVAIARGRDGVDGGGRLALRREPAERRVRILLRGLSLARR